MLDRRRQPRLPPRLPKDLRTAWLLLLLRVEPSYGYVLRQELAARGLEIEPGTLYRALRELEGDSLISSRWAESSGGPRSRVYTITAEGERCLNVLAETIAVARDSQVAFLAEFDHASETQGPDNAPGARSS